MRCASGIEKLSWIDRTARSVNAEVQMRRRAFRVPARADAVVDRFGRHAIADGEILSVPIEMGVIIHKPARTDHPNHNAAQLVLADPPKVTRKGTCRTTYSPPRRT